MSRPKSISEFTLANNQQDNTVPLESIGAFSAILPRWNCSLYLRFDLGKPRLTSLRTPVLPRFFADRNTAVKNRTRWCLNSLLFPLFQRLINFNKRDVVRQ